MQRVERADPRRTQLGFTLIELLTVVAIVSILAGVAIAQFTQYRANAYDAHAYDARAVHDLGNAVMTEEPYFASKGTYFTSSGADPAVGLVVSETVTLEVRGDDDHFTGEAKSSKGSGKTFRFDSVLGWLAPL